jgi:hypothetical protein
MNVVAHLLGSLIADITLSLHFTEIFVRASKEIGWE